MSSQRVAYRYAKALIELGEEQKATDQLKEDMELFTSTCAENRDFRVVLSNPVVTHSKKLKILRAIFDNKISRITQSFFEIVTRKNRENLLEIVASEFLHLYNVRNGIDEAAVTTTFSLDLALRNDFELAIKKITGKKVVLKENVNRDIIGGYILKIGDRQIDESVRTKLNELKYRFSDNPYVGKL